MSKGGDAVDEVFFEQRAAGLRRRWTGKEPLSVSPLCAASLPLAVPSSSFDFSEPSTPQTMARLQTDPKTSSHATTPTCVASVTEDFTPAVSPQEGEVECSARTKKEGLEGALKRGPPTWLLGGGGKFREIKSAEFAAECSHDGSSRTTSGVDPIFNRDGVTVRRPAKLGISSGDPVAVHISKTKTFNFSARLAPRPSRLNLSIHRRTNQTASWGSFGGSLRASESMRRGPFATKESDSLPKIVQFSPSLKRVLSKELGGLDVEACYQLGVLLFRQGQTKEAVAAVLDFIERNRETNATSTSSETRSPTKGKTRTCEGSTGEQRGTCKERLQEEPCVEERDAAVGAAAASTGSDKRKADEGSPSEASPVAVLSADTAVPRPASPAAETAEKSGVSIGGADTPSKQAHSSDKDAVLADVSEKAVVSPRGEGPLKSSPANSNASCEIPVPVREDSLLKAEPRGSRSLSGGASVCSLSKLAGVVFGRRGHMARRAEDLREGWGAPRFVSLEKLLGHLAFEDERFEDAIRRYWRAIDLHPGDAQMFTSLGLAYYELEELENAEAAFEHSLKLDEKNTTALSVLAMMLLDRVSAEEENASFESPDEPPGCVAAERDATEDKEATREEERVQRIRLKTERCVELLRRCLRVDAENILAKLHLAQVFFYREEWEESAAIFKALLVDMPEDTHLLNNLGARHPPLDGFERELLPIKHAALDHFVRCCAASPDSVALHATCGLPLCENGQEQKVIDAYTAFIKQHPNSLAAKAFKRTLGMLVFAVL
ncbi:tetratricopeptide repeat-containing protein [Cyclospora cayetanensis]|uniref:Tetratricopeptide repeat-containing protein n=1 Tax=Cyclospora cayetanensis TaxID=88456 RepID=A0A1D3CZI1_9EIME|nr:tetratricopeptide repeat-containing protein [Cyclospora cayetanensis]